MITAPPVPEPRIPIVVAKAVGVTECAIKHHSGCTGMPKRCRATVYEDHSARLVCHVKGLKWVLTKSHGVWSASVASEPIKGGNA